MVVVRAKAVIFGSCRTGQRLNERRRSAGDE
jgi:hypothetical protein